MAPKMELHLVTELEVGKVADKVADIVADKFHNFALRVYSMSLGGL